MKQCNRAIKEFVDDKQNKVLKEFLIVNEPKVKKLSEDYKLAKVRHTSRVCRRVSSFFLLDNILEVRKVSRRRFVLSQE